MKTIEYNEAVIQVPESWADITIGHYEGFYKMEADNEEGAIALIAAVCKTTPEVLRALPAEIFTAHIQNTINFVFTDNELPESAVIDISGGKWMVHTEDKITLGEWVDVEQAQKGNNPLSGTLAVICRPVNEPYDATRTEEREALFRELPVDTVRPLLGFFLRCKTASEQLTQGYGSIAQAVAALPQNIKSLVMPGGGIRLFRIWPIIKYIYLIKLLKCRLRQFSHS